MKPGEPRPRRDKTRRARAQQKKNPQSSSASARGRLFSFDWGFSFLASFVPPPRERAYLGRLYRDYFRKWMRLLFLSFFLLFVVMVSNFAYVRTIEPVFNEIFASSNRFLVFFLPLLIFCLIVIRVTAYYFHNLVGQHIITQLSVQMRSDLFRSFLGKDLEDLDSNDPGGVLARFNADIDRVLAMIGTLAFDSLRDLALLLSLVANLFYTNWQLALCSLLITPLCLWPIQVTGRRVRKLVPLLNDSLARTYGFFIRTLEGHLHVKVYQSEAYFADIAARNLQELGKITYRNAKLQARLSPLVDAVGALAIGMVIFLAAWQIAAGTSNVGAFMSFLLSLVACYRPIKALAKVNVSVQAGLVSADRFYDVLDKRPAIRAVPAPSPAPAASEAAGEAGEAGIRLGLTGGRIVFENVSYVYRKDVPAVHNLSFTIQPGQRIALVGPSGAGKTTVFKLLMRLYDPASGVIRFNDRPINQYHVQDYRRQFSIVLQDTRLFPGTLAQNIAFGERSPDMARVQEAAQRAHLTSFIDTLPEGLETPLGSAFSNLSGGQRQRVEIARVLYRDAPILLLDEITAFLDAQSEHEVVRNLEAAMAGRTVILITHRLQSVQKVNNILVMQDGTLVESGTHEELYARENGLYRSLSDYFEA